MVHVIFSPTMKLKDVLFLLFGAIAGCATTTVSPAVTFLAGLNSYQDEMERLGIRPERWPDRQRLAESIKTTHVVTLGGSKEFNRLVDLDLRRREFLITLRDQALTAERAQEMKQELVQINEQLEGLKKLIKGQIARNQLREPAQAQRIENVATIGLLNLAMDSFAAANPSNTSATVSTQVGSYVVMDEGTFSMVRTPEGQTFRCLTTMVPEAGASISCQPAGAKP
jgi:hypothetical protein